MGTAFALPKKQAKEKGNQANRRFFAFGI